MIKVSHPKEDIPETVPVCAIRYQGKKVAIIPMRATIITANLCLLIIPSFKILQAPAKDLHKTFFLLYARLPQKFIPPPTTTALFRNSPVRSCFRENKPGPEKYPLLVFPEFAKAIYNDSKDKNL